MLPPIKKPAGKYRIKEPFLPTEEEPILLHEDLPKCDGKVVIEEPKLLVNDVDWQPGVSKLVPPNFIHTNKIQAPSTPILNNKIGGKFTLFLYLHGGNTAEQSSCVESLRRTINRDHVDLRVIANEVGVDSLNLVRVLNPDHLYRYGRAKAKYKVMREVFWDNTKPINSRYVIWIDDIARIAHHNWLDLLTDDIIKQPDNVGAFGMRKVYPFRLQNNKDPRVWFKSARWYKGKHFLTERGSPAPNGSTIHFCDSWFFVLKTEAIRTCDIPCARITGKGGDIVIGEQLHQGGYRIKDFNTGKSLVYASTASLKKVMESGRFPWE